MGDHAEFKDHIEMGEYAERSGLDYTWAGTNLFAKRERTLPPDQFEVRPVRTGRGITMVGLPAAITRRTRGPRAVSGGHGQAASQDNASRAADGAIDGAGKASSFACKLRWMRCRTVALAAPIPGTVGGGTGAGSTLGGELTARRGRRTGSGGQRDQRAAGFNHHAATEDDGTPAWTAKKPADLPRSMTD
jgi:hypothetical protein